MTAPAPRTQVKQVQEKAAYLARIIAGQNDQKWSVVKVGEIRVLLAALTSDTERVARLRAALARLPRTHYDTHGWFVCNACQATARAVKVRYPDPKPGHATGHMEAAPFTHEPDCAWAAIDAALGEEAP